MRTRAADAPWRAGHLDEEEAAASVTKPCWWSADDRGWARGGATEGCGVEHELSCVTYSPRL